MKRGDMTMPDIENKILAYCKEHYPEHEPHKAVDEGDVFIYYLRYVGEDHNNFGCRDLTLYYNTWYPSEYGFSTLTPIFEK